MNKDMAADDNFRVLAGFTNYLFTDKGTIINKQGKEIGNNPHNNGYTITTLVSDEGESIRRSTHRWIYQAWHGEIPQGTEISHNDDNKYNNAPSNLSAMSHRQNCNSGSRNAKISASLRAYYQKKKENKDR